jgi:hypothetical protein
MADLYGKWVPHEWIQQVHETCMTSSVGIPVLRTAGRSDLPGKTRTGHAIVGEFEADSGIHEAIMTGLSIFTPGGELVDYRPERGLKAIAVAEAAEKHFARAKNPEKLYEAVKAKLTEQRKYALWRETVRPHGYGPGRGKKESTDRYSLLPKTDPGAHVARRWRIRLGTEEAFAVALYAAQVACLRICERRGGVKPYTGDDEWYTPAKHIDRVRRVLGSIDLDPASNLEAQKIVKAKRFFSKADDALTHPWHGRVWLNPPYSRGLLLNFVSKLLRDRQGIDESGYGLIED